MIVIEFLDIDFWWCVYILDLKYAKNKGQGGGILVTESWILFGFIVSHLAG